MNPSSVEAATWYPFSENAIATIDAEGFDLLDPYTMTKIDVKNISLESIYET